MAAVQTIDPIRQGWNASTNPLQAESDSVMLAILNIAGDVSILSNSPGPKERLRNVLSELAGVLHPRGTLAIPMESSTSFDFAYLEGERWENRGLKVS